MIATVIFFLLAVSGIVPHTIGFAQQAQPTGPVYVVQEGDSLWGIAARFGTSVADLQSVNGISDPGQLRVGDQIVIPGFDGIQGTLTTSEIPYGDTLRSLSRELDIPEELLVRLNRLSSPDELYVGFNLIAPISSTPTEGSTRASVQIGQSMLELAVAKNVNPWLIVDANSLSGASHAIPDDVLRIPGVGDDAPGGLPEFIRGVVVDPLSLEQGKAVEVSVLADPESELGGSLLDHELHFFSAKDNSLIALQGVHAMTEPGIYPMEIQGSSPDGQPFMFKQMVRVKAVDYPYDQPLTVDPATIDPAVTRPEDAQWSALAATATPEQYWNGIFKIPSPLDQAYCLQSGDCWSSRFGNRRSYNGSAYSYFHAGLDIVGKTGTDIYAPADGVVVFTGPLTVRGNATMIDHGHGVYTGYMHQSEILVKPGDRVKAGQLIGRVGGTGRVQGPHLHWEVWVGGVQIDPIDWLERVYP